MMKSSRNDSTASTVIFSHSAGFLRNRLHNVKITR